MFERLTEDARSSVEVARSIVEKRGDKQIQPTHLLLGVYEQNPDIAITLDAHGLTSVVLDEVLDHDETASGLALLGIDQHAVAQSADRAFGSGVLERATSESGSWFKRRFRSSQKTMFTRSAKTALERSLRIALDRGDAFISDAHVALGALSTRQGPLSMYLALANIDIAALELDLSRCVKSR